MNTKEQKFCVIMGVVFGVSCYFSVQAGGSKKLVKKSPESNFTQISSQSLHAQKPKFPLSKISTSSSVETGTSLVSSRTDSIKITKQDQQKNDLKELDKHLKEPGRKIGLEKLLEYATKRAEDCSEVNLDAVKKMFAPGTELNHIEREVGEKFFSSKEEFLVAGVKKANNDKKLRVADIFSIRREMIQKEQREKMPTSIDELLKKQCSDRSLVFFHMAREKLQQLNNGDSKDNNALSNLQIEVKAGIEAEVEKIKGQDKKFDQNKLNNDVLSIARGSKSNPEIMVYFSALVKSTKRTSVQKKSAKKNQNNGWFSNGD